MKKIILLLFALILWVSANAQLNFNARRISADTLRARSSSQGGANGVLNWPYNFSGTFPTIAVNDTLLHEWIKNLSGGGSGGNFWKTDQNFALTETLSATIPDQKFFSMKDSDSPKRFLFNNGIASGGSISMVSDSTGATGGAVTVSATNARLSFASVGIFEGTAGVFQFSDQRSAGNKEGILYNADYSADFIDRSLIDKGYSDSYFTGNLTDTTPTDAEIDAVLGTPATRGAGFKARIKDLTGTGLIYIISTDGTSWYYSITTLAL